MQLGHELPMDGEPFQETEQPAGHFSTPLYNTPSPRIDPYSGIGVGVLQA